MPLGIFPIASEALGTKKPVAAWVIFVVTILASVAFLISVIAANDHRPVPQSNLLQWDGDRSVPNKAIAQLQKKTQDELQQIEQTIDAGNKRIDDIHRKEQLDNGRHPMGVQTHMEQIQDINQNLAPATGS